MDGWVVSSFSVNGEVDGERSPMALGFLPNSRPDTQDDIAAQYLRGLIALRILQVRKLITISIK